ncbi:MAG: response regulator [Gemmatimonadota bacterium]|nr:MAG: response regulator [Gemmatimonadota bacterium]
MFGAAGAAVLALVLLSRSAVARRPDPDEPQGDGGPDHREGQPAAIEGEEPPPEVMTASLQFLKAELIEAANALNNRLNVIRAHASFDAPNLTSEQRNRLQQIKAEVDRAAQISAGLLHKVSSAAPDTIPEVLYEYDGSALGPATVLLVESDEPNRAVITRLLERLGLRVVAAANGLEAYEVLEKSQIDCVISDLRLPFVGGRTLFEQIEYNMPHLASRFVFVTGDYVNPESRDFLDKTGQPVIGKPYELEALLGAVAAILRKVAIASRDRDEERG